MEKQTLTMPKWNASWVVRIGTHKSVDKIFKAFEEDKCEISYSAKACLRNNLSLLSMKEEDIHLVYVSLREIGLDSSANFSDVCKNGVKHGLELCPADTAFYLCLQYKEQPRGLWLRPAMKTITDSEGLTNAFRIVNQDNVRRVLAYCGGPETFPLGHNYIFRLP